ncbi:MAG: hypothetical protein ACLF0G_04975 [Candidatus Brocadiia bacterium]
MARRTVPVLLLLAALGAGAGEKTYRDADGLLRVRPAPVAERFRNAEWPEPLEKGFWRRANHAIEHFADSVGGNTFQENEKAAYPRTMFAYLAGRRDEALAFLQAEDAQAGSDHRHTLGIDYYWCFTLKGQMRKYFYFGDVLERDYRKRMFRAAKIWTDADPLPRAGYVAILHLVEPPLRAKLLADLREITGQDFGGDIEAWRRWYARRGAKPWDERPPLRNIRPHPRHGTGGKAGGWGPDKFGTWVDVRNTDNLRAMRETSIYLMAEETGNETTRRIYKARITRYVAALYHVGMGEWDSEAYHAHTMAPYLNLYDFAKDPETKLLAKAALDWLAAAGALKYCRGGFGGPTKRDYGGANRPFGAGVSHLLYLYFGDCPIPDPRPHYDDVHAITSAYRPPLAVVHLARKDFPRPAELVNTKPAYENWFPGKAQRPETWETLFFGHTFCLGTCVSDGPIGDVGPFKLLAHNSQHGVDFFVAFTGKKWNTKRAGDQMGQYRNLVVWLRPADGTPFGFLAPRSAAARVADGTWFFELERTWLAVRPIGLQPYARQEAKKFHRGYDDYVVARAESAERKAPYVGFALEVGEAGAHPSAEAFRRAVKTQGKLDLSALDEGKVVLTGTDGHTLAMSHNPDSDLPAVVRDGQPMAWGKHFELYRPIGARGPIALGWREGTLRVEAGGEVFTQTVSPDGKVTFSEQ